MQLTGLDRILWACCFLGHCVLFGVLLVRHRAGSFPVFTSLIAANIVRTIVLFFTLRYGSSDSYFYTYWTLALVDMALQLGLVAECAAHVFQPLGVWARDLRRSFLALLAASLMVAGVLTWLAIPPTRTMRLALVIRGDFFSSALLSELFVAMVALSVTMGLPWRTHVARVAQGLGVYSLYGILTDAAHSYFGSDQGADTYARLSQLQIGLYLACVIYWIVTLAKKEPEPRKLPEQLHRELRALHMRAALMLDSLRTMGDVS